MRWMFSLILVVAACRDTLTVDVTVLPGPNQVPVTKLVITANTGPDDGETQSSDLSANGSSLSFPQKVSFELALGKADVGLFGSSPAYVNVNVEALDGAGDRVDAFGWGDESTSPGKHYDVSAVLTGGAPMFASNWDAMNAHCGGDAPAQLELLNNGYAASEPITLTFEGADAGLFALDEDECSGQILSGPGFCRTFIQYHPLDSNAVSHTEATLVIMSGGSVVEQLEVDGVCP